MSAPSACSTGTRQLFTNSPFMRTEHEPHSPSPHPSLVPVRCRSSRRTSRRRFIAGTLTIRASPFTLKRIVGQRLLDVALSFVLIARLSPPPVEPQRDRGRDPQAAVEWN